MRNILYIAFFLFAHGLLGQERTPVYLIPGQGADCRLFAKLEIDTVKYKPICLSYTAPNDQADMQSFAKDFLIKIDTTQPFYLIGVSLGGMIATEIAHMVKPLKTIIISSAKNKYELPARYRFQNSVPIYRLFPPRLLKKGALLLQPIVEPDRKKYKSTFVDMLSSKTPAYFKSTIKLIVTWERTVCTAPITHIHGENDHTIPIRNVSSPIIVKEGSHMMTLTASSQISKLLNELLESD